MTQPVNVSACPVAGVDDLEFGQDRSAAWRRLRAAGDVTQLANGTYVLTSAEHVEAAATEPDIFSSRSAFDGLGSPLPLVPIAFDPPEHTSYRRLLDKFFGPRRMAEREPELRAQVAALVDNVVREGTTCDVLTALAVPFPAQVFLTLFGLPLEARDQLVQWKDSILSFVDPSTSEPPPQVLQHAAELFGFLSEHLASRRGGEGDDLLTKLLHAQDEERSAEQVGDGTAMTDEEIIGLCFLFVLAGLDTVTSVLGFAFATLAQDPELRATLVADPSTIPNFVEELLRVDGPVPFTPRVTTKEVQVGDVTLPSGASCLLSYGAANRDERRYEAADTLDPDRKASHFAFGRGPHRCLGSHLARLELRIVLEEWHRRVPDYELAPGTVPRTPWPAGTLALDHVQLVLHPAR